MKRTKYEKRIDGRDWEDMRPMSAKVGVIPRADGSAMFRIGKTTAYAAVYGPKELHPRFLQDPSTGILRCDYNMLPFSGHGDRVRPGTSRRSREIAMVMQNALLPVLDLTAYPNAVVDIFVDLPETDAGTRCAAITAASMALADAGLNMKDLVCAVAVGKVGDKIVTDLNYDEEAFEGGSTDIPVALIPSTGEITLLQIDGELSKEDLNNALTMAKKVCKKIYEVQKQALKESYNE